MYIMQKYRVPAKGEVFFGQIWASNQLILLIKHLIQIWNPFLRYILMTKFMGSLQSMTYLNTIFRSNSDFFFNSEMAQFLLEQCHVHS